MRSHDNKWLVVNKGVILTEHIDPVIFALDAYFKTANLKSFVTSGLRTPEDQIRIIRNAIINNRLADQYDSVFDDLNGKTIFEGEEVYNWQPGWSKLLNIGFIVNPPYAAKCLMDYYRPGSSENKKGQIIGQSPHTRGTAFDIGGGPNGLSDEIGIIKSSTSHITGLKGYLLERNNNCLHVDTWDLDIGKFR